MFTYSILRYYCIKSYDCFIKKSFYKKSTLNQPKSAVSKC
ncbi:hypothetical protein FM106_06465 [Brachybacterium faecium]|nr:hypothetical protein FM106_06465 [Brachybacterium faecium]